MVGIKIPCKTDAPLQNRVYFPGEMMGFSGLSSSSLGHSEGSIRHVHSLLVVHKQGA